MSRDGTCAAGEDFGFGHDQSALASRPSGAGFGEPATELSQALELVDFDESEVDSLRRSDEFGSRAQSILVG